MGGEGYTALRDAARLAALRRTALLDTPADEAFDRLARIAAAVTGAPIALVTLVDEDRQFLKACVGLTGPAAERRGSTVDESYCQHVVAFGEALTVEDARRNPMFAKAAAAFGAAAYAGFPLMTGEGHVLGTLCVLDREPREWSPEQVAMLRDLARAAMDEIELRSLVAAREREDAEARETLASLRTHVASVGEDGLILWTNPAWARATPQDAVGTDIGVALRRGGALGETLALGVEAVARGASGNFELEYPADTAEGRRWFLVSAAAQPAGGAVVSRTDVTTSRRAREVLSFLAQASDTLASGGDRTRALVTVARAAVPRLADLCLVDLAQPEGLRRLCAVHASPDVESALSIAPARTPAAVERALSTGRAALHADSRPGWLDELVGPDAARRLERLGARSAIVAPFGGDPGGAFVVLSLSALRRYDQADLEVAEELGRRAGSRPAPARPPRAAVAGAADLTPREREVLGHLAAARDAAEIAGALGISAVTARNHIQRAMEKLGARSRLEAVVRARQAGLIADA